MPNLPEALVEGNERDYISWFFKGLAYSPSAITEEDIDVYASQNSAPGAMRAGFEYYRAIHEEIEQNTGSAMNKLTMPVLVLGADYYAFLGDIPVNFGLASAQAVATDVTGVIVPFSGHWIPEEQPEFLIDQLSNFFGNSTNGTGDTGDTGDIFDLP